VKPGRSGKDQGSIKPIPMVMPTRIVVASSKWKQESKQSQRLSKYNQTTLALLRPSEYRHFYVYFHFNINYTGSHMTTSNIAK
jgi:hypothetical protein